jgi:hypothetical protein
MIITYFGKQFFKISQGEMTVALNPVAKNSKTGVSARFGADLALSTVNHPDYNGIEQVTHGERAPFVISGPGDYEVKKIFVKGVMTESVIGGKKYLNTPYAFELDGISVAFLGVVSGAELSAEAKEVLGSPDILFVPMNGGGEMDAKVSAKLASTLEPKLIIPMDYDELSLKIFLKEVGEEKAEVLEKLTLKKKDLEGKEGEVVVLKPPKAPL